MMVDRPFDFVSWHVAADALPTIVFAARASGPIEFINRRWSSVTGHPSTAALDEAWHALIHPRDLKRVTAAWQRSLESGDELAVEYRLRWADGSYHKMLTMAAPLRDRDGAIVCWYGSLVEIAHRKHSDEPPLIPVAALEDSERKFRSLAESIPVICWTADSQGSIDWYNRRWYEYTGQTPEESAGWGWQAAHHPDDFLDVMRKWPRSIETGEPCEMEYRLRRDDGSFRWFLTRIEPFRGADGTIVRWYGSSVDVDAQKKALERTKRIAETLQEIFLPKQLPQRRDLRLDALYLPAEKDALVGGDWFDAFELPDGRLMFSIGDVAGHGLQASALVGRLRQAIFTLAFKYCDPATILEETDRILSHQEPDIIVTALVGFVDASHTTMTYANAGHPPPLVAYRSDQPAERLPYGEPPLGIGFKQNFVTRDVPIRPDTVVAMYTDGMIEFSHDLIAVEDKLRTAVALVVGNTSMARPATAVQEIVFDGMPARDDAALLLLQFSAVDSSALHSDPAELDRTWRFHSSDAYTVHVTRHDIVEYLRRMARDPDQVFAGELVLGEMLANTVKHAPGIVEVHIDWTGTQPIVTVRDTVSRLVDLDVDVPPDAMHENGRGIFLVKSLAEESSVTPSGSQGKEWRATLPILRKTTQLDDALEDRRRQRR